MQHYYALQYVSLTYIFIAIGTLQKVNTHWINERHIMDNWGSPNRIQNTMEKNYVR
jgi:hypothetical protein